MDASGSCSGTHGAKRYVVFRHTSFWCTKNHVYLDAGPYPGSRLAYFSGVFKFGCAEQYYGTVELGW